MLRASKSLECLLQPVIKSASKKWLSRSGYATREYLEKGEFFAGVVHGWVTRIETGVALPESLSCDGDFTSVTPDRVEQLANYAGIEHDTQ